MPKIHREQFIIQIMLWGGIALALFMKEGPKKEMFLAASFGGGILYAILSGVYFAVVPAAYKFNDEAEVNELKRQLQILEAERIEMGKEAQKFEENLNDDINDTSIQRMAKAMARGLKEGLSEEQSKKRFFKK